MQDKEGAAGSCPLRGCDAQQPAPRTRLAVRSHVDTRGFLPLRTPLTLFLPFNVGDLVCSSVAVMGLCLTCASVRFWRPDSPCPDTQRGTACLPRPGLLGRPPWGGGYGPPLLNWYSGERSQRPGLFLMPSTGIFGCVLRKPE